MSIGTRIRYFRKLAGLSQVALAEKMGARQEHVSQMERDLRGRNMGVATLDRFAEELGVPTAALIDDAAFGRAVAERAARQPVAS